MVSLLLTAPPYILAALWFYCISWWSDVSDLSRIPYTSPVSPSSFANSIPNQRKNTMYPIIVFSLCVAFIVYIIALSTLNTGARYFAMMLMPSVCCL